jgi:hypothetical protein
VNDTHATYLAQYKSPANLPPGITDAIVANPNLVLQDAIAGQNIQTTVVIQVSANPVGGIQGTPVVHPPIQEGGIQNIPFLTANANPNSFSAIFWLETVKANDGTEFLQMQYSQTVILEFAGLKWPHISVATLVKQ